MSDESAAATASSTASKPREVLYLPQSAPTSGPRTTEFWLSVVTFVGATVLCALGKLSPELWAATTGGVSGLYSIGRGLAKQGAI